MSTPPGTGLTLRRAWVLTLAGVVGLTASAVLAIEKYQLLKNPFYVPSCSVNETLNCTQIMQSDQAALFGFPNPYLGLVGFTVVVTIGAAALAGARFARWFWRGLSAGIALALLLVLWLAYQSIAVIGALCPYCMLVWVAVASLVVTVWPTMRGQADS